MYFDGDAWKDGSITRITRIIRVRAFSFCSFLVPCRKHFVICVALPLRTSRIDYWDDLILD
jgi:hypothetical protein